jgi:hypothetical protein
MSDTADILAAIAGLGERIDRLSNGVNQRIDGLSERIDDLAAITSRHFDRIEGDATRIEGGVNAIRCDLYSLRKEVRGHDDRITALERK